MSYEFEQECRRKALIIAKHIKAMLKVGKRFALHKEDIRTNLEHFGPPEYEGKEYIFDQALGMLYETDVKSDMSGLYWLRESKEQRDQGWY